MAIVTSIPSQDDKVKVYEIPDSELQQYEVSGEQAAQMFPESDKPSGVPSSEGAMTATRIDNSDSLGEVQAYRNVCVCRRLLCNAYTCWWHYYYCYC